MVGDVKVDAKIGDNSNGKDNSEGKSDNSPNTRNEGNHNNTQNGKDNMRDGNTIIKNPNCVMFCSSQNDKMIQEGKETEMANSNAKTQDKDLGMG